MFVMGFVVFFYVKLHAFTSFLVPCCDVSYDFRETQCSFFLDASLFSKAFNVLFVLFVLFVFIYVHWCPRLSGARVAQ